MCGIAGIVSLDLNATVDAAVARRMGECLVHRGPDADAVYTDEKGLAALAFRRLSIIDLSTGMQPIGNEDKSIHVICNGEIYNFQSLREDLSKKGHRFTTAGDVEPIVHLYEAYGMRFLERLDGFFALALFDAKKRKLVLAIDRVGKKPLYYTVIDRAVYFASELKAIKAVLPNAHVNMPALADYLRFGYIPAPDTVFAGVMKLPPGHVLEINLDYQSRLQSAAVPPPVSYCPPKRARFAGSYEEAKAELTDLLTRAVGKRLIADVPLGILLSGGLDSAIVTALASRAASRPIKTFSVGFKSELYNELPLAGLVARKYRTEHTELVVTPDLESILGRVSTMYDEPFADSSAIPTALICRKAREHVTVVLTGDGGDEGFCGYDRYRGFALMRQFSRLGVGSVLRRLFPHPGPEQRSTRTRAWRFAQALSESPAKQYSMLMRIYYDEQLEALAGPELRAALAARPDFVAQMVDSFTDKAAAAEKANLCDYATYLPGDLLVKMDRASMASSLETRAPLLDHAVLEFAHALPLGYKMTRRRGKRILRDTFGHLLPPELLSAPKRGFGVPLGQWLRGPLKGQMTAILSDQSRIARSGLVAADRIAELCGQHLAGRFDHSARLWSLMVLEEFFRSNFP